MKSSSASASFGAEICRSKSASAGCLAGVFKKFFCSGGLPTYLPDHTAAELDALNLIAEEDMVGNAAPGIVARLMGLDSLPEIDVDQTRLAQNSTSHSRSMNSVDYLFERSRTRRELPILWSSENDEFLVLSFENVKESKEFRRKRNSKSRERKTERLPEKKNVEEPEEIKRLNDEGKLSRTMSADSLIPSQDSKLSKNSSGVIHLKQISGDRKMRTKQGENHDGIKMEESINVSEDSSPVSVLDRCQFLGDHELPTSGPSLSNFSIFKTSNPFQSPKDDSTSAVLNSRRKLSTELENHVDLVCKEDDEHISKAREISYVGEVNKKLPERRRREMSEMIRRLTEAEMVGSNCNNGDFQTVGAEIQWVVLEELIDESVHQLSGTHLDFTNF